ncbi:phage tail spike protein [Marininema halotolerans]|uniref:Phage minor structural protein, N-terminal region n=1 Tax=Marininema halotolerans TaxID=1155944 RepID=A0A1I6SG82_9BACL|nr:phage tail protein [Marininema halotolerans]SFS75947.1 phage minor structural protein, N-terminal region [Marininema halotolerans]
MLYNRLGSAYYNRSFILYNQFVIPEEAPYHKLSEAPIVVLDQERQPVAVLDHVTELVITEEINGEETLDLTLPFDDPKRLFLENENMIQLNHHLYVIRRVHHTRSSAGERETQVYAEALWYDLQYTDPMQKSEWADQTPYQVLQDILAGTDWRVGVCEVNALRSMSVDVGLTNRLTALREVADLWGGSIRFHGPTLTVNHVKEGGFRDPGIAIIYRKNMDEIEADYDTTDLVTRLYPYGKGNVTIKDANNGKEYLDNFQYTHQVRTRSFKDERFTNPYHLLEKTEAILEKLSVPRLSYRVRAADLSMLAGMEHESFRIGDMIRIYDEELGIDAKTHIARWQYNVLEPWNTELELESKAPTLSDLLQGGSSAGFLQSEDSVERTEMLELMVFNYLLNSRADDGFAYWVNNGWEIDSTQGYSGKASFRCEGQLGVEKTLTQTIEPSHRDHYTVSMQIATDDFKKGPSGKLGIEVVIHYDEGDPETQFLPLA